MNLETYPLQLWTERSKIMESQLKTKNKDMDVLRDTINKVAIMYAEDKSAKESWETKLIHFNNLHQLSAFLKSEFPPNPNNTFSSLIRTQIIAASLKPYQHFNK
ncbi:MAG: hypothetical protein JW725_03050 [Candidatus Babeliaceae bacterium]|nr:hypothetical protein [Candidatus Babeliaceae bacterium]